METKPEPFTRHGTAENRIEVSADEILNAIAEGRDVNVAYAAIEGNLDIGKIADRLGRDKSGNPTIKGDITVRHSKISSNINFQKTTFNGKVYFGSTAFDNNAYFSLTTFSDDTYFVGATFSSNAAFAGATFSGYTNFSLAIFNSYAFFAGATFSADANFTGVIMDHPANFPSVRFRENTVLVGLWNLTIGKINRLSRPVTGFIGLNTGVIMDASSNPYLKRYIDDEQWIASWRQRSWWRKVLFVFWELTSHCGRSFGLWLFWSFVLAVVFGFLYKGHIHIGSVSNWYTPFYFSVVTFTTLGFGDVTPIDWLGQFWITLEVVCGYLMLGGLISIFANKFARRS